MVAAKKDIANKDKINHFEHFLEQYFTLSQFNFHFLRQTKGLLQTGQIFEGRFSFFNLNFFKILFPFFYCIFPIWHAVILISINRTCSNRSKILSLPTHDVYLLNIPSSYSYSPKQLECDNTY